MLLDPRFVSFAGMCRPAGALAALLVLGLAGPVAAQTITGRAPARNARNVRANTTVRQTFSAPIPLSAAQQVRVFSSQAGGQRAGSSAVSGDTATFTPAGGAFKPGEVVLVTAPGGGAGPREVYQFTVAAGAARGVFSAGAAVPVATGGPYSVAVADVDNDGDLDLLSANQSGRTVSVRLNDGVGQFNGATNVILSGSILHVIPADVDGDGDLDLIAAGTFNAVLISRNNGTGTFGSPTSVSVGDRPFRVAAADVDGDGDLDLLSANAIGHTISVRLNNGAGAFSGTTEVPVNGAPSGVTAADVDSDGDLDLLSANSTSTVSLRLNDGTGSFSGTTEVPVVGSPTTVTAADMDGDGDLDLLTSNEDGAFNTVSLRLNNGAGVFSGTTNVPVGSGPSGLAVGDIDGDGDLDLLVANRYDNTLSVRFNNGSGTFSGPANQSIGLGPFDLAVGDFDGDGDLDVVTANFGLGSLGVRLNQNLPPQGLAADEPDSAPTLWPNPVSAGAVQVGDLAPGTRLTLTEPTGRLVLTTTTDATGAATLDARGLAAGVYVVRTAEGRPARLLVQ